MSVEDWTTWSGEDWLMFDRDQLVQVLSKPQWWLRTDAHGRNFLFATIANKSAMLDKLVQVARTTPGVWEQLLAHEDLRGVALPAYLLRYGMGRACVLGEEWKLLPFAERRVRNARGEGLFVQLSRLAASTSHPFVLLPHEDLPRVLALNGAPSIALQDWQAHASEEDMDRYAANALLSHTPEHARHLPVDMYAISSLLQKQYSEDEQEGALWSWLPATQRMVRLAEAARWMAQGVVDSLPLSDCSTDFLLQVFERIKPDLVHLMPHALRPERNLVRFILEERRLGVEWEAFELGRLAGEATGQSRTRRL